MIVPAPPPAFTCKLPGPWHDSQPTFFAFSPFACNRACVDVRKSRTICSWQVAHSSEPTNSAPGMLGGARIVRLVVLQDKRITASATAPPIPHNKLSRLPSTHRPTLECHTDGKYAQKQKNLTTRFFGFFLTKRLEFYRRLRATPFAARYCVGDLPKNFLKTRLNCESD